MTTKNEAIEELIEGTELGKSYVITIDGEYVRDCQVCIDPDQPDPEELFADENWVDVSEVSIFCGIYDGPLNEETLNKIASYYGTSVGTLSRHCINE